VVLPRIKGRNTNKMNGKNERRLKVLILYFSATGNTEKVAHAIRKAVEKEEVTLTFLKVTEAAEEELYDYDLVFLGSPSIQWLPAKPALSYIEEKHKLHGKRGDVKLCAPKIPGKTAVVFCTYSGPHTGISEATTAGKYMRQFFEHIGFEVAGEWYIVGEVHGSEEASTKGKLGDIRGRPNEQDLAQVENDACHLVRSILLA
jgi:flavodoxin